MEQQTSTILREACVRTYREAVQAELKGANRIELCENLSEGGTTPSYGTIAMCVKRLKIPIAVMIRPHGDLSFRCSADEVEIMVKDIEVCKQLGVEAVVFGVLTSDCQIDLPVVKRLVDVAQPLKTVFHMAFDQAKGDKEKALETLINLGITRVLTKGCTKNATEGRPALKKLVEQAKGRIGILAGGSVTSMNYKDIVDFTGVKQVHGTKIVGEL